MTFVINVSEIRVLILTSERTRQFVSAIYRSACTAPRIFETQDEGQRQCMGLQYRKREQGRQCEFRCLRR
jgi:putative alpha-1,2-mannosidase